MDKIISGQEFQSQASPHPELQQLPSSKWITFSFEIAEVVVLYTMLLNTGAEKVQLACSHQVSK